MPDPSDSAVRVEADVVTVGLIATPPDHPAQVVERLRDALPDLLSQADAAVLWEVEAGWGEVEPRRDGGVEALLDDMARRRDEAGWDVVVCLTDLPLQRERVPLVARSSVRRGACVVSLPALGVGQLRGTRTIVPGLVAGLAAAGSERSSDEPFGSSVEREAPVRRVVDDADDGEVGFRQLGGCLRRRRLPQVVDDDQPGHQRADTKDHDDGQTQPVQGVRHLPDRVGGQRKRCRAERPDGEFRQPRQRSGRPVGPHHAGDEPQPTPHTGTDRLFNIGTVLTLVLAAVVSYLVLLVGLTAAAGLLIDTSMLEQSLGRPVGIVDYLTVAWLISSLATVGGAIGSGLEDEQAVRAVAYGYHPEPVGWRDERRDDGGSDG